MLFKRFLIWSSGGPPVRWSGTIYASLKEGMMGNIHVKLYEIWTSGPGGDVKKKSLPKDTQQMEDAQSPITIAHLEPLKMMYFSQ